MSTTATQSDVLTIPELSIRTGIHLDKLRRAVRTNPAVRELTFAVGPGRVVKAADVPRIADLLNHRPG